MTATRRPAVLGQNQYGKAETRVVRIVRDGATHHVRDLNVSVALAGDLEEAHYSGSNAAVLPTDTAKNTVFAFAKEHGVDSPEQFGIHLARHFVTAHEPIRTARVRVEEYAWGRIATGDDDTGTGHSFVRTGRETRIAEITFAGASWQVLSGLRDLTVMNTTDSEFWGFRRDGYTTLKDAYDRILATEVAALWRYGWRGDEGAGRAPDWDGSYERAREHLLRAFAETYSLSLQQTLYEMGARVIGACTEIDEVRFSLPNKHHFPVDLEPFGLRNDAEVYVAADRPYGLIEATVLREGATAKIPADTIDL